MLARNPGQVIIPQRTVALRMNPRALVLPRGASSNRDPQFPDLPVSKDWTSGQNGILKTKPVVLEVRVEGSLRGLTFQGDVSALPGGYEAVFERYLAKGELSELVKINFNGVFPFNDEMALAICDLVPHTGQLEEFSMHNCGAPSAAAWRKLLVRTQGWTQLKKLAHTGDKVASLLLGMSACYPIPSVPGLDDDALLTMARYVSQRRPWQQLEKLTLQNIVYPVIPGEENPDSDCDELSIQTDGRDALENFAGSVWQNLKSLNLDPTGLDGWTKPASYAMGQPLA